MTYDVTIFGIHLTLNPVAFTIPIGNGWSVYWYGIIIATGFLLAIIYGFLNAKRFGIDTDRMLDVALVTTPVAVLCARLYYVIFDGEKLDGIGDFFGISTSGFSGLAIYGGVIGAFVCGGIMCKLRKVKILDMFDLAAIAFLIGQGIGRWGNFINQEAYGTFTGSDFWGMTSNRTVSEVGSGLVHPCFLYESIWCLAGALVLHLISKKRGYSGQIVLCYGAWYGFGRGFIELLRTDSLMIGTFKVSALLSFALCIACVSTLVYMHMKKNPRPKKEVAYESVFGIDGSEDTKEKEVEENGIDN